jgi:hypothetical protein
MTSQWRKNFFKAATFSFTVPITISIWGPEMSEPLIMSVCFPLSEHRNWDLRMTKLVGDVERNLRGMQSFSETRAGSILREICEQTRRVETLSSSMVRQVLHTNEIGKLPAKVLKTEEGLPVIGCLQDKHNYRKARNGDFIMCALQYDLCHFRNIQNREPGREDPSEVLLLTTIFQANLDAFWARKSSTVSHNATTTRKNVRISQERFGVTGSSVFKAQGPHPLEYSFGMLKAYVFLYHSLNQGRNESNLQFETIRKT